MKHVYLINPAAGRGDSSQILSERIMAAYADCPEWEMPMIYMTTGVGDATRFVRTYCTEHKDEDVRFYACGGDGTLSEVVGGAAPFSHASVGLVPVGTGNDFMKNFTCAESFMDLEAQRNGEETVIDLMRCNGKYCINMINVGFDCEVVVKTSQIKRRPWVPAGMAYGMGVAMEFVRKPGVHARLSVDGGAPYRKDLLLCAIGNGAFYGGGFLPVPHASVQDGLLDMCIVNDVSRMTFVRLISSYKNGQHVVPENERYLQYVRGKSIHMQFPKVRNVCLDGEVVQMKECCVEIVPGALRFVLPRGSAPVIRPAYEDGVCAGQTVK